MPTELPADATHRPPMVYRVGVVGHRPDRLADDGQGAAAGVPTLATVLRHLLELAQREVTAAWSEHAASWSPDQPVFRAISPLAEGTDRVFAEQALAAGYRLACPLPFAQAEYERDFEPPRALEPDSVARFRALVEQAEAVFESDGQADEPARPRAYEANGALVRSQSDLLIVVWDGYRRGRRGGTEAHLLEAQRCGASVVWVDARQPHTWQVWSSSERPLAVDETDGGADRRHVPDPSGDQAAKLRQLVRQTLAVPASSPEPHGHDLAARERLARFYQERRTSCAWAKLWTVLRNRVADAELPWYRPESPPASTLPPPPERVSRLLDPVQQYYDRMNSLAVCYGDQFRTAWLLGYLLAAGAVGMALLPMASGWLGGRWELGERLCGWGELSMIVAILALVSWGRREGWHDRWLDYRLAAEMIRHLRLVAPLGGDRPSPRLPAHWVTYGHVGDSWVAWYVRSLERSMGLPRARADAAYLSACLWQVRQGLHGQITYHERNAHRCHNLERRLELGGAVLLTLTLLACAVHLAPTLHEGLHLPHTVPPVLTMLCAFLPALGAALAGINNHGEFRRVAQRSRAMVVRLGEVDHLAEALAEQLEQGLAAATDERSLPSQRVAGLAAQAALLMVEEVCDWRIMFLDRPQELPA